MKEYSLSFTAGSLLFPETMEVIELFLRESDWTIISKKVLTDNILQYKSPKSTSRIFNEIKHRISQFNEEELRYLLKSDRDTQTGMLWLAICMQYRLIYEFAFEVIPEKMTLWEDSITYYDYERFYETKAEDSPRLANIAESTQYKAKTIVFKILHQVGILNKNKIVPMILPPALGEFIKNKDNSLFRLFPLNNRELERWLND
ncbi:DUF1819 family protein [bacterium]|nr:DUF1819 family protein [bacterium]